MDPHSLRTHVAALFARGAGRTTRIAVEQELVVSDAETGAAVAIGAVRAATDGAAYAGHLTFEPGGQVELSLPCAAGPAELAARLHAEVAALRADCSPAGIRLDSAPTDPRPEAAVPLQLTSSRYVAMQRHFDSIGPAGRRMMRRTASTQICLDWWPGRVGTEQWRLLNLAGPFLAAALARSVGPEGRLTTWLSVDPDRTAFDDRLVRGDDPVGAYTDLAAGAGVFVNGGVDQHLSTLFPPVRPRGRYLEVRFLDAQPIEAVGAVASVLATLLYDDASRRQSLAWLEPEQRRLEGHWHAAAAGDEDVAARGLALIDLTSEPRVGAA